MGTGFSYANSTSSFCTTDQQIADQLLVFFTAFLEKYPEFVDTEFWIATESYG